MTSISSDINSFPSSLDTDEVVAKSQNDPKTTEKVSQVGSRTLDGLILAISSTAVILGAVFIVIDLAPAGVICLAIAITAAIIGLILGSFQTNDKTDQIQKPALELEKKNIDPEKEKNQAHHSAVSTINPPAAEEVLESTEQVLPKPSLATSIKEETKDSASTVTIPDASQANTPSHSVTEKQKLSKTTTLEYSPLKSPAYIEGKEQESLLSTKSLDETSFSIPPLKPSSQKDDFCIASYLEGVRFLRFGDSFPLIGFNIDKSKKVLNSCILEALDNSLNILKSTSKNPVFCFVSKEWLVSLFIDKRKLSSTNTALLYYLMTPLKEEVFESSLEYTQAVRECLKTRLPDVKLCEDYSQYEEFGSALKDILEVHLIHIECWIINAKKTGEMLHDAHLRADSSFSDKLKSFDASLFAFHQMPIYRDSPCLRGGYNVIHDCKDLIVNDLKTHFDYSLLQKGPIHSLILIKGTDQLYYLYINVKTGFYNIIVSSENDIAESDDTILAIHTYMAEYRLFAKHDKNTLAGKVYKYKCDAKAEISDVTASVVEKFTKVLSKPGKK